VVAFGGVPIGGIRSSERIRAQPNAVSTQLERAQLLAQQRDHALDSGTSLCAKFSIASIPDDVVKTRASMLGVSLGVSPSQVSFSIKKLKDVDLQRTLVMLHRNEEKVKAGVSSVNNYLVLDKAFHLSEDLRDEEQQGSADHKDHALPVSKPKRVYKKKKVEVSVAIRTSARLRSKS
jgi:hypothetical protein